MVDIFVSYKREDRERVELLVRLLEREGFDVWWDPNITPGERFADVIDKALEGAKCVVVGWSEQSIRSPWVCDEAGSGRDRGILVPLSLDGARPPLGFRQFQTPDFKDWSGDAGDKRVLRLIDGVRRVVSKAQQEEIARLQEIAKAENAKHEATIREREAAEQKERERQAEALREQERARQAEQARRESERQAEQARQRKAQQEERARREAAAGQQHPDDQEPVQPAPAWLGAASRKSFEQPQQPEPEKSKESAEALSWLVPKPANPVDDRREAERQIGRRRQIVMLAVIAILLVGGGSALVWRYTRPADPPVIKASSEPVKIAPKIPDRLTDREEVPSILTKQDPSQRPASQSPPLVAPQVEAKKVPTISIGPDGTQRSPSAPKQTAPQNPTPGVPQVEAKKVPTTSIGPDGAQQNAPPAKQSAATAVAQRAFLYEENPSDPQSKRFAGSATWRIESVSPSSGMPPELAVRADVEVPERRFTMAFSIRRNSDKALPVSHTIEIVTDFPFGGIANVTGILMKDGELARGAPLAGLPVKVTDSFFLIGLSNTPSDQQSNVQALKTRSWFDIPIVYKNGRRVILAIEKGAPGDRAFEQAFKAWGQ